MFKKKYVLCPGHVMSADGDEHYIGVGQLIRLYGVSSIDCIVWRDDMERYYDGLIRLCPRHDGNYTIPER